MAGRTGGCANSSCLCGGGGAGELFLAVNQHVSNPGVCKKSCNFRCTASIKASKKLRLLMPRSACLPPHPRVRAEGWNSGLCRCRHVGSRTFVSSGSASGQQDFAYGLGPSENASDENIKQLCCVEVAEGGVWSRGVRGETVRGERSGNGGLFSAKVGTVTADGQGRVGMGRPNSAEGGQGEMGA